ncbi:MAG: hypothetical protein AB7U83_16990 [Vicinamibacterales bacterium]
MTRPSDDTLRRYLLRQLPEAERDAVESAYFADAEVAARLDDLDDDLASAYLDGALAADERTAFEARLGQPAVAARLELVRGLRAARQAPMPVETTHPPRWTIGLAAAAVLVLAVGGWWLTTRDGTTDRPPSQASAPPPATPSPAPPATAPAEPPVVVALTLPMTATRSGGAPPTVEIPENADQVALRLAAPLPPLADLAAEVRNVDVDGEWRGAVTPPGPDAPAATTGEVVVAAASLPGGDYVLTVRHGDAVAARAFFRVVRPR